MLENSKRIYGRKATCQTVVAGNSVRVASTSYNLRKFHNLIKRYLISEFASGAGSFLDLACGRGGDIAKWCDAGIKSVRGFDLSAESVVEATVRYESFLAARPEAIGNFRVNFEQTDSIGRDGWACSEQFDAVSCMFALHYFCGTERSTRDFFEGVASNLKVGGYFFGTVPNGKDIVEHVSNTSGTYESKMLRLERKWEGKPAAFGSVYSCTIDGTVTEEGSDEYLVYSSVITTVAALYGLVPVTVYTDPKLCSMLEGGQTQSVIFKRFLPTYRPGTDPSMTTASQIFSTFCFRKKL